MKVPKFATPFFSTTFTSERAHAFSAPSSTRTYAWPPATTSATTWRGTRFATTSAKAALPWWAKLATLGSRAHGISRQERTHARRVHSTAHVQTPPFQG